MASGILMQKGTALWLAKRTKLSNKQIADFCNMHEIEVNAFKMGLEQNIVEFNPVEMMLLSQEMIEKCEADDSKKLEATSLVDMKIVKARKSRAYMKRHEVVNAVYWLITKYPDLPNEKIIKLLKCTKTLVSAIRDKTFKDYDSLTPRHPVVVELCTQEELDKALAKYIAG